MTAAGVLTVLVLGIALLSFSQRLIAKETVVSLANHSATTWFVRVADGTTGRIIDTVRLDPWTRTIATRYRPDIWWRDLSAEERAAGRESDVQLELLGDGCELVAAATYYGDDGAMLLDSHAAFYPGEDGPPLQGRAGASVSVPDPCAGAPAPPVGRIANVTSVPILVDGRIVVPACSVSTVHPGDLASPPDGAASVAATPVTVPSLAVQQERWPIRPITVMVSRESVDDWSDAIVAPDVLDECGGLPLEDHELVYEEPYEPYVPPVPSAGG